MERTKTMVYKVVNFGPVFSHMLCYRGFEYLDYESVSWLVADVSYKCSSLALMTYELQG